MCTARKMYTDKIHVIQGGHMISPNNSLMSNLSCDSGIQESIKSGKYLKKPDFKKGQKTDFLMDDSADIEMG